MSKSRTLYRVFNDVMFLILLRVVARWWSCLISRKVVDSTVTMMVSAVPALLLESAKGKFSYHVDRPDHMTRQNCPVGLLTFGQGSLRWGTRWNAVPIVEKLPEHNGTAFLLLKCFISTKCARLHDFAITISTFSGDDTPDLCKRAPGAWTQTPISAWLASVPYETTTDFGLVQWQGRTMLWTEVRWDRQTKKQDEDYSAKTCTLWPCACYYTFTVILPCTDWALGLASAHGGWD